MWPKRRQRDDRAAAVERGHKLLGSHQEQEAIKFLSGAVQQFPDDPEIRVLYASILLAVRPDDVAAEAAKAVELGPNDPVILVRAGHLLFGRGDRNAARSCAARAKELVQPDFILMSGLLNLEGLLAAVEGRDDLAEEKLRAAWEGDPSFAASAVDLAKFLANRARQVEALEVIDEALKYAKQKVELERLRSEITGDGARSV
jgi:Flp pilus assembly protein TadD